MYFLYFLAAADFISDIAVIVLEMSEDDDKGGHKDVAQWMIIILAMSALNSFWQVFCYNCLSKNQQL